MKVKLYFNLLVVRYVLMDMGPAGLGEGLILTWPWWDRKTTMTKGWCFWHKQHVGE